MMAICQTCGSDEFDFHDGALYCSECQTQVKESKEEKDDDESVCSNVSLRLPKSDKKSSRDGEKCMPWLTIEGFNEIILGQVDSLVMLGASPQLKDAVLYMWTQYLQKCDVAFNDDPENVGTLGTFPRNRDFRVFFDLKKIQSSASEASDTEFSDMTSDAGSSKKVPDTDDEIKITAKRSRIALKTEKKLGREKLSEMTYVLQDKFPHHMTISKTLCFCYLGLLYVKDDLLLSDLIRFAYERRIPYMNPSFLSSKFDMTLTDSHIFTPQFVPVLKKIAVKSSSIAQFLELPKIKHRPLMPIVARFLRDLNLPNDLVRVVNILHRKLTAYFERDLYNYCIPLYEIQAMALIIIALKMLFVLDGQFEWEHSYYVKNLNMEVENCACMYFAFENWFNIMKCGELFDKTEVFCKSKVSKIDLVDVDSIAVQFHFAKQQTSDKFLSKRKKREKGVRHEIRKLFSTVIQKDRNCSVSILPTSFPIRSQLQCVENCKKNVHAFKERDDFFAFIDFTTHRLVQIAAEHVSENPTVNLLFETFNSGCRTLEDGEKSSPYWHINYTDEMTRLPAEFAKLYDKFSESFQWLLRLTSNSIEVKEEELYREIVALEKELFGDPESD